MPTVMTLRLKALRPLDPGARQLHGLACALFEGGQLGADSPAADQRVVADHLGPQKPFAVWPLQPVVDGAPAATGDPAPVKGPGPGGDFGQERVLRAAWLTAEPLPSALTSLAEVRLGHVTCAVTEVSQRSVTHGHMAAGVALDSATVTFRSPTYFSQNGSDVVLPDPRLILGSWRRQWNAWLPAGGGALEIDDDAWRELHRSVHLADFDLRTERWDSGHGSERAGFTGTAALRLGKDAPLPARSRFGALVRFAEFCGTGAQTTHGFGATTVAAGLRLS
jgi:CRISPR-associated endoribonuclease Cas6